jgi:signal transduction histidine kinase
MKRFAVVLVVVAGAAIVLFWAVVHQMSGVWLDVALSPEVKHALQQSLDDQKALRAADPAHADVYRRRFEATRTLLNRVEVIRISRARVLRRFELTMLLAFAVVVIITIVIAWLRAKRAAERERMQYIERLATWQGAARRHAHEIRGPLTAARLEVDRFAELARNGGASADLDAVQSSIDEELQRLTAFTQQFSSFGAIAEPLLRRESLGAMVDEFCATFAAAWPGMTLRASRVAAQDDVCADRDLVRQVLVNLCTNSANAGAHDATLTVGRRDDHPMLVVSDDGSGIPESLRPRVFDPYVTTHRAGEGMGLGLAISRKIMLDHGGDLELVRSSPAGTAFRMTFGAATCS